MALTKEQVIEEIKPLEDPEMHIGLVDLGLIYDVDIVNGWGPDKKAKVHVTMTLTSPMCPIGPELSAMVKNTVLMMPEVTECDVDIVFEPPWDPHEMASDFAKDELGIW